MCVCVRACVRECVCVFNTVVGRQAEDCSQKRLKGNYNFEETENVYQGLLRLPGLKDGHVLVIG